MMSTESEILEFKSEVVSDICKEVIAFANTRGGEILIGVADDGTAVGVPDPDSVMLQVSHMVRDSVKPDVSMFVHYEARSLDGREIVAVTVQKGTDRPYYLASKGLKPSGVYVRSGSSSDPATDTAIRKMIRETDGDRFEEMRSLEQNLTFVEAEKEFLKRGVSFGPGEKRTLGLLSSEGVYSNLGLLLSDQCPGTIKAAAFSGADKEIFQDRREFCGSLFRQMEDLYAYLEFRNQKRAEFDGLYRTDILDYPETALREALLNCIVHREYAYSASTLVSIFSDRIEFVSIGGLPEGIEIEDIKLGLSVCRNPRLAAVFYRLRLIEAYGTGIPKIFKAYQGLNCSPKIEVTNNAFKITLPNRNINANAKMHRTGADRIENLSVDNLSPDQMILNYLKTHDSITRKDVDKLLDVSQPTSNRILRRMARDGSIISEGVGKSTKYHVKNMTGKSDQP